MDKVVPNMTLCAQRIANDIPFKNSTIKTGVTEEPEDELIAVCALSLTKAFIFENKTSFGIVSPCKSFCSLPNHITDQEIWGPSITSYRRYQLANSASSSSTKYGMYFGQLGFYLYDSISQYVVLSHSRSQMIDDNHAHNLFSFTQLDPVPKI
ncbi:hypothetical protein BYT27DRAFT_7336397, partial [Phlegmacium glaucopus]